MRLWHSIVALIRAVDLLACTIWLSALYPFGLADQPTGRHMISSYVGKAAMNNMRWALIAERVIDEFSRVWGDGPGHCRRAYEFYRRLEI